MMATRKNSTRRDAKGTKTAPLKPRGSATEAKAPKRITALDAAARVLAEAKEPMSCGEMIAQMAAKGYWTSPGGKTPSATLYAGILRELNTKGAASRFEKTDRGKFGCRKTS
jgi:hypothetical protein